MAERRRIKSDKLGQPIVNDANRESMLSFLQWSDPNGTYTDDVCRHEGVPTLTWQEARDLYCDAIKELTEADLEPWPPSKSREETAQERQRKVADAINLMGLDVKEFAKAPKR